MLCSVDADRKLANLAHLSVMPIDRSPSFSQRGGTGEYTPNSSPAADGSRAQTTARNWPATTDTQYVTSEPEKKRAQTRTPHFPPFLSVSVCILFGYRRPRFLRPTDVLSVVMCGYEQLSKIT